MGFPLGPKPTGEVAGYHCWAFFAAEDLWHPVDISEADKQPALKEYFFGRLTADRVAVTQGRDLRLEPAPAAGPLNYLVDPYVEVDGQPHDSLRKNYRYENRD